MKDNIKKRLPKILKINRIDKKQLRISVLFGNGEDRIIDFGYILKKEWQVTKLDPEHILLDPAEFVKVAIMNHTLSWSNAGVSITGPDGKKKKVPYEVGADTLYGLSESDETLSVPVGMLLKRARLAAKLSQQDVAELSGTSRTYITRLENGKQDIEVMTLKKIVEAGLNKRLTISIE